MPSLACQLEPDAAEQEALFCMFAGDAMRLASPDAATFYALVRNACDHVELDRLQRLHGIADHTLRGFMFLSLVGEVLSRTAVKSAIRYNEAMP